MIASTNHVYRAQGVRTDRVERSADTEDIGGEPLRVATIADIVPITEIMTRGVTCAARDLAGDALAKVMVKNRIGCVPVVDETGCPVGMVTKLDLVEQLVAMDPPADRKTACELMMPIAMTLGPHATVAQAAALMAREEVHHVPIVGDEGALVGIVSSMDVVRWLADNDGYGAKP
jgi:CBS domain-containing protein